MELRSKIDSYIAIPSLSRNEGEFIAYLKGKLAEGDIPEYYSVTEVDDTLRVISRVPSKNTIFSHADRVPTAGKPKTNIITMQGELYLESQLDNAVSIAVMMHLIEQHTPVNWVIYRSGSTPVFGPIIR